MFQHGKHTVSLHQYQLDSSNLEDRELVELNQPHSNYQQYKANKPGIVKSGWHLDCMCLRDKGTDWGILFPRDSNALVDTQMVCSQLCRCSDNNNPMDMANRLCQTVIHCADCKFLVDKGTVCDHHTILPQDTHLQKERAMEQLVHFKSVVEFVYGG